MDIQFISIGGWCGTKIALNFNGYLNASFPFDYVRSSIIGVIDCFENDFLNYFPKDNFKNINGYYSSSVCEFQHEDIGSIDKINSFNRKIARLKELLNGNKPVCFLRTICLNDYDNEIKYYKKLQEAIEKGYPNLNYIICFIITKQENLCYYKNLDSKTFIFTLNNTYTHVHDYLQPKYKYIFDFILNNNLFFNIPNSNANHINLIKSNTELQTNVLFHT
jgi:hypothetical protein